MISVRMGGCLTYHFQNSEVSVMLILGASAKLGASAVLCGTYFLGNEETHVFRSYTYAAKLGKFGAATVRKNDSFALACQNRIYRSRSVGNTS